MRKLILSLSLILLAGCQSLHGYERTPLAHLMITDGTTTAPYLSLFKNPPLSRPSRNGLPIGTIATNHLKGPVEWMRAYDFDADGMVRKSEMTQAWLVRIARFQGSVTYLPNSLKSDEGYLMGINLDVNEEKAMRYTLENTGGKEASHLIKAMNQIFSMRGGGGEQGNGRGSTRATDGCGCYVYCDIDCDPN